MQESRVRRWFGWIRDLWIAIGITLLVFVLLEGAYVGQLAVRAKLFGSDDDKELRVPGHPYAQEAWYPAFVQARNATREKYDAWRGYWAYPTTSPYLNVDSAGYRVTIQSPAATASRRVWMLGGSAMWGYTMRDSLTVPSLVAAGLRAAGITDVEIVNMAQPGYTINHELATLTHELERREAPSVVVLFNGINDIRTTQLYGEPGHAFFEPRFARLYEVESQRGLLGSLLTAGERSRLIGRLGQALGASDPWKTLPQQPTTCPSLGEHYRRVHRQVQGMAQTWGFNLLLVQQPNHAATRKPLTPFEKDFAGPDWHVKFTRDCSDAIDSTLVGEQGKTFASYTRMFDADSGSIFLDRYGHVTEVANKRIADALLPEIIARLAAISPRSDTTPGR